MTTPICPYCKQAAVYEPVHRLQAYIYDGATHRWYCYPCDASVGCHKGTDVPMGVLADGATRRARKQAHEWFDKLWAPRGAQVFRTRGMAYDWLGRTLKLDPQHQHIAMLDQAQCEELIEAVRAELTARNLASEDDK